MGPVGRRFLIADVFSARPFGGNQLAVVVDGDGMAPATMQAVAAEFGFAKTSCAALRRCRLRV